MAYAGAYRMCSEEVAAKCLNVLIVVLEVAINDVKKDRVLHKIKRVHRKT